ncbi:MAG: hypothetical protein ABI162_07985 [Luteolibacter sp.]
MRSESRMDWWLLAILTGLLVGGWIGKSNRSQSKPLAANVPPRTVSKVRAATAKPDGGKRDFSSLINRCQQTHGIPDAGFDSLGRASSGELKELLSNLAGLNIVRRDWTAYQKNFKAMNAIAHELYLREGTECLKWAESTGTETIHYLMLCELALQDPVMMNDRLGDFWMKFGTPANGMISAAGAGAAMRGAADLLAVEKLFGPSLPWDIGGFAEGFDFHSYLTKTESMYGLKDGFRYWAALDPDAAGKLLREEPGKANGFWYEAFGAAFRGRAEVAGDAEAAHWMGGVLMNLSEKSRDQAVFEMLCGNALEDRAVNALIAALPTDRDRITLVSGFLVLNREEESALRSLTALNSETLQSQALSTWLQSRPAKIRGQLKDSLETKMEKLNFPPARRDELRALIPSDE